MLQWICFLTLAGKECYRVMRIWKQTIFPPIITSTLYFIIFGEIVGHRVGHVAGMPYVDYVAPGFIMLGVIVNAFSNSASSVYLERYMKSFDLLLSAPIHEYAIVAGFTAGSIFRGSLIGITNTAVAAYFVDFNHAHLSLIFATTFTSSFLLSGMGILNGFFANSFDQIQVIPNFFLTPLVYLGGVFFSLKMLPPMWQNVALFNPVLYICDLFRYAWSGHAQFNPYWTLFLVFMAGLVIHGLCGFILRHTQWIRK